MLMFSTEYGGHLDDSYCVEDTQIEILKMETNHLK